MSEGNTPVGVLVARARKRRGLTQQGLAQRTRYSRSHIAQVEKGHKVATPAFVAAVAAALGVDPSELYGQPFRLDGEDDHVHRVIPELRRLLAYVGFGPELEGPPRDLAVLEAEATELRDLLENARYVRVGTRLPSLVEELTFHAYDSDLPRAWAALYRAHHLATGLTRRLGYVGDSLAWMERFEDSARRSGNPHLPLMIPAPRALILMSMNEYAPALTLLDWARRSVNDELSDAGEVFGYLSLRAAVVAARAGKASLAWDYFGLASEVIESGRLAKPVHSVQFMAENVTIHGAAVALELGDLDEAARRDRQIGPDILGGLIPERRAHHQIDMARVHVETGDDDRAMSRVLSAERIAPQMTRFHPSARTVAAHLGDVRRTLPEPLRGLQRRMGL
ncbi:helix-turn-helix transcriptional regulator [Actinocorallia sp. API 0066]|uniref:helix-turn-helix domain-containing protein n=1 Tax=Actinocorallia sp. API 0066 TaxID=2896846 RepID=UPI001E4C2DAD|nr:helix-turn-helix transcriptional regulator [Actinocorallia sp. API 0066]MCD0453319.1 helix-turn-helix transcriptional regulator [Actinocorallia sp. API 0066]